MTKKICFSLIFFAVFSLTGCQGFNDFFVSPNSPCTSNCTSGSSLGTSTTSSYFYVLIPTLSLTTSSIAEYQIVAGVWTPIGGGEFLLSGLANTTVALPTTITVSPNNAFLYLGMTDGSVYAYAISSGALNTTAIPVIYPGTGLAITSMQVDATNSWLVFTTVPASSSTSAALNAIPVSSSTGASTSTLVTSALGGLTTPVQLAISPDDSYVYVALGTGGVDAVPFTSSSTTSPFSTTYKYATPLLSGGSDNSVAVDPQSRFVYVGEGGAFATGNNPGGLRMFVSNLTACTNAGTPPFCEVSGSPYPSGGIAPVAVLPELSGQFVYIANQTVYSSSASNNISTTSNVSAFGIATTTFEGVTSSSLVPLANSPYSSGPYTAGTTMTSMAVDSSNSFILAVNVGGTPSISEYTFLTAASNDGELTSPTLSSLTTDEGTAFSGGTVIATVHPN